MSYSLDIQKYNLDEILVLFDLYDSNITLENLKSAKKKVLKMHPDKSKLPSEYFLFYKKAFDVIVEFYDDKNKMGQEVNEENTEYNGNIDDIQKAKMKLNLSNIKEKDFGKIFNDLYEKNMITPKKNENEWFKDEKSMYLNDNIDYIKREQKRNTGQIIKHKDIQMINSSRGTDIYDDFQGQNSYFTCDASSKLQYEDLRKVHRNETIFPVDVKDFDNMKIYNSQEKLKKARDEEDLIPKEYIESKEIFDYQEKLSRKAISEKDFRSKLKNMEYNEKNKSVLSYFLRLE